MKTYVATGIGLARLLNNKIISPITSELLARINCTLKNNKLRILHSEFQNRQGIYFMVCRQETIKGFSIIESEMHC